MKDPIIGRESELALLDRLQRSRDPEFLALYGRRRVGKTFLVKEFFEPHECFFELTGEKDASLRDQLVNFRFAFQRMFPDTELPPVSSWREALHGLADALDAMGRGPRIVLFFDELPWLAGRRSGFLQALDHFWNAWGNRRNLLLVVCGSAASWMIGNLLHNKGGLYNRVTAQICLQPFNLAETERYLRSRDVVLGRKDILELYMGIGGIPHYLRSVERGQSVAQVVDALCFQERALLRNEFGRLFASLFERPERHIRLIRLLAKRRSGMTRKELAMEANLSPGGGLTRVLEELTAAGFVAKSPAFRQTTRDAIYRLIDEYCLFYLTWVEGSREANWQVERQGRAWQSWCGFSFESVCLKHVTQIKQALGIGAVSTTQSGWRSRVGDDGLQVDLVIDRADNCINLAAMKFAAGPFVISKSYAESLRRKLLLFRQGTGTVKNLFLTMLTTYGCKQNDYAAELVDHDLTMDCLFTDPPDFARR